MRPRNVKAGRKVCAFCVDKVQSIDYKDINKTSQVHYGAR